MVACICVIILILQAVAVNSQSPAILSVTDVIEDETAIFECSLANLASTTSLNIHKDGVTLYTCTDISFTCSRTSTDNDYSEVIFTALGTASAKGEFTVANADQTRDGGDWTCKYGTSLISLPVTFVVSPQSPATLSVTNVLQGATTTFECSYPSLTSPTTLDIYKDGVALYQCTNIASTCSKSSTENDYSDVTFTDLGKTSAKGTFTVANADQTRDGGDWTCKYGSSLISSPVTFVVSGANTTQTATSPTISSTLSSRVSSSSSSASSSTATVPSTQESETKTTNPSTTTVTNTDPKTTTVRNTNPTTTSAINTDPTTTTVNNVNPTTTSAINTDPTTTTVRNTNPKTTSEINTDPTTTTARNTNPTTTSAINTDPTTTTARNTNPTTTSARNTTDETNNEWQLVYFVSVVPTMITLTVIIIVITFVCNRTRQIKRSRPPSGMEKYSVSRRGVHNMNPAFEPPASYSMAMEHSNPFYVSREHMLKENTGSSGTNMIHDQIFFENTCTTKELLEGIEGLHFSARYMRNWSHLNDSTVNLFK